MGVPLYRAMKAADDEFPIVEDSARGLGARAGRGDGTDDVVPDADGVVQPNAGGMSVTPDDPRRMNPLRRPRALGGVGKYPLYVIDGDGLGIDLAFRRDPRDPMAHAFVEPSHPLALAPYRRALGETRPRWSRS